MDNQLEELFADLFAERIASLDTTDSEQIVIGDLKRYLGQRNYDNNNINLLLFQFYQYYDINISYEEVCNVANNNMYFYMRNIHNNQEPDNQEPDNQEPDNQEPDDQEPDNQEPDNQEPDNNNLYNQPYNYIFRNINHYIFSNILDDNQNLEPNNNINNNININNNNNNINNDNLNNDNLNNNNNDNINNNNNLNNNRIIYINNNFINRLNNFLHVDFNNNQQNQEYNDIPIPRLNSNLLLQAINIMLPQQNQAMLEPVAVALDDKCLEQLKEKVLEEKIEGMCMICFDEFDVEQTVLELPCKHLYHKDCISPYFKEHSNKCPICRCEVGKSKPLL